MRIAPAFAMLLALLPVYGWTAGAKAGPYQVEVVSDPAVLPVGKAALDISVTDSSGKHADGLQVKAIAQMPNMAMGEREQIARPTGTPGHYRMSQSFSMAGGYVARIAVKGPQGSGTAAIDLETGKSTAKKDESGFSPWPWLAGLAVIGFTAWRLRRTNQRIDTKAILSRPVLGTLVVLGVVIAGAVYAIDQLRRPGSMTPIEAQTMTMDMPPPEGTVPVTLATVQSRNEGSSIRVTGQVVGYVEQDVVARTSGVITWMPGYVGTEVKRNQVIARLDTTQLAPQVAQQSAMVESAQQGVGVAKADYRQSQAMIHQAESEYGQFKGALDEAQSNLAATQYSQEASEAGKISTQADERDAQAKVAAAQADQRYWRDELARESSLLAAGAVSRDEFEKERSEAAKSAAAASQAQEAVRAAQAKTRAAEAGVRQAVAMVSAARHKVEQARSELGAHHAHVQTAGAEAASARQKIAQSEAGVRQAEAGLQGVVAQAGYAEVRAQADGVITQRVVSPGTLASAGQVLLKVSQIQPIRLQASVSESDMAKVQKGASFRYRHRGLNEAFRTAQVATVSPSVDPATRIGTVEAVLPNTDRKLLPGQFLEVEIAEDTPSSGLSVPTAALQVGAATGEAIQAKESEAFVWVAHPVQGQPNHFTVERRSVQAGDAQGDFTEVKSGLKAGDRVVVTGGEGLTGAEVVEDASPPSAVASTEVRITENGFEPDALELTGAGTHRVTFLRTTDNTCAKQVVFPSLHITRDLPLNVPVDIELPANAPRELNYACGMNMLKGKVIIK